MTDEWENVFSFFLYQKKASGSSRVDVARRSVYPRKVNVNKRQEGSPREECPHFLNALY